MVTRPKKQKDPNRVQAIVGQGKGKRPEALVRGSAGQGQFKRLEEALPRDQVESVVNSQRQGEAQQAQQQAQQFLNPQQQPQEQPQPIVDQAAQQPQEQPLQTTAQLLAGNQNPVISGLGNVLQAGGDFLGIPQPQTTEPTTGQIASAVGNAALVGASVGGASFVARKIATKTALNTAPEAANILRKYGTFGKRSVIGKAPKVGELANNARTTGLLKTIATKIWNNKLATLGTLSLIDNIFDSSLDDVNLQNSVREMKDQIIKIDSNLATENDQMVRVALFQERELLQQTLKEIGDPSAWEEFISHVPFLKNQVKTKFRNIAEDATQAYQASQAALDDQKRLELQELSLQIGALPPDVRELVLEEASLKSKLKTAAEDL